MSGRGCALTVSSLPPAVAVEKLICRKTTHVKHLALWSSVDGGKVQKLWSARYDGWSSFSCVSRDNENCLAFFVCQCIIHTQVPAVPQQTARVGHSPKWYPPLTAFVRVYLALCFNSRKWRSQLLGRGGLSGSGRDQMRLLVPSLIPAGWMMCSWRQRGQAGRWENSRLVFLCVFVYLLTESVDT